MTMNLVLLAIGAGTPLILAVVGETLLQKAGVINIGLEGLILAGAFAAVAASHGSGNASFGVVAAIAASLTVAVIFGLATINGAADQIVTGAALNFLALGGTSFLYGRYKEALGSIAPALPGAELIAFLAWLVIPIGAFAFLRFSRAGLRLRACGEYPAAIELQGMRVSTYRWGALLVEGALTGLAGAYLALVLAPGFAENMSTGRGFIALAIVILARWNTVAAIGATALFSLTTALQYQLQAAQLGIQFHLLLVLPYLVTLLVLATFASGVNAPRYLGKR